MSVFRSFELTGRLPVADVASCAQAEKVQAVGRVSFWVARLLPLTGRTCLLSCQLGLRAVEDLLCSAHKVVVVPCPCCTGANRCGWTHCRCCCPGPRLQEGPQVERPA